MGPFFSFMYTALRFIVLKGGRLFWVVLVFAFNMVLFFFKVIHEEKTEDDQHIYDIHSARVAAARGGLGGAEIAAYEEIFDEKI